MLSRLSPTSACIIRKTKRRTGINRSGPKLKRNVALHKTKRTSGYAFLIGSPTLFSLKNQPSFAEVIADAWLPPPTSSVQLYLNGLRTSSEGHSLCVVALRFGARCDRFLAFRLRGLDQRFESGHAERFKDFAAEGQTRPGIPTRIRCIVNRIRTRHAGKSKRVVGAAVDHTA